MFAIIFAGAVWMWRRRYNEDRESDAQRVAKNTITPIVLNLFNKGIMFSRGLRPAIDIVEDEDKLTVKTELPGIPKDEVHVMIEDGVLTITSATKAFGVSLSASVAGETTFQLVKLIGDFGLAVVRV